MSVNSPDLTDTIPAGPKLCIECGQAPRMGRPYLVCEECLYGSSNDERQVPMWEVGL